MAATEPTGEEALAEQAGTAFTEGNTAKALELLAQLQKQREDGALLLPPPPNPRATRLALAAGLLAWARARCGCPPLDRRRVGHTTPRPLHHLLPETEPLTAARVHSCGQTPRCCTTRPCHSMC